MTTTTSQSNGINKNLIVVAATVIILAIIVFAYLAYTNKTSGASAEVEDVENVEKVENFANFANVGDAEKVQNVAPAANTSVNDYTWLSERKVTAADLTGLSKGDLRLLRNAIFARHGYIFKSEDLSEFFSRFDWYQPKFADVTPYLSDIEKANINYIQSFENGTPAQMAAAGGGSKNYRSRLKNIGFTEDYSDIVCYVRLSDADVAGLSNGDLRILRNTIYARHGRRFKSADLDRYFRGFSWYHPRVNEISPNELSAVEKHNIALIQRYE